jgi:serine/threonine-protein kinase
MSGTLRTSICERIQLAAGSVIAERYVLRALIGAGGYGEVWYAGDAWRDWRWVAIKLLRPNSCSAVAQGRFESEMQALVLLRPHRHIVELLDHGVHDGQRYMVMEYLSGGSLAHWLNACRATNVAPALAQVWRWFDQVCQALGAAHLLVEPGPIIHRDINPNNIVLAPAAGGDFIVKVVDFGVARLGRRQHSFTGEPVGTRGYMSPEQAAGDCDHIHPSSDVFALGLLLLEMLTLRVSAPDGTLFASIAVQDHRRLRALLPTLRSGVPRALWTVVEKALQPQVARRYEDAETLRLAVQAALDKPGSPSSRSARLLPGLTHSAQGMLRKVS